MKRSITYFYRDTKGGLYTTRNDPRPQFFHTRPEMIPEEFEITRNWRKKFFNKKFVKKEL